jgi:hypothetical protein
MFPEMAVERPELLVPVGCWRSTELLGRRPAASQLEKLKGLPATL